MPIGGWYHISFPLGSVHKGNKGVPVHELYCYHSCCARLHCIEWQEVVQWSVWHGHDHHCVSLGMQTAMYACLGCKWRWVAKLGDSAMVCIGWKYCLHVQLVM